MRTQVPRCCGLSQIVGELHMPLDSRVRGNDEVLGEASCICSRSGICAESPLDVALEGRVIGPALRVYVYV